MAVNRITTVLFVFLYIVWRFEYTIAQVSDAELKRRVDAIFGTQKETSTWLPPQNITQNCECVAQHLCRDSDVDVDGIGVIDIRFNDNTCESYLEKCCEPENIIRPTVKATESHLTCGWRNFNGVGFRIIGDSNNEANFGEFPWMVGVLKQVPLTNNTLNVYQCGGSLIHPRVVVTAAHCVNDKHWTYIARAGEWDANTNKEFMPSQDRKVKTIITHPNYNRRSLHNDIALLIVEKPYDLCENVNLLCLPTQGTIINNGTRCWASGWGKDQFGAEGVYQVILKKIDLPLVDSGTCQSNLRTTRLGRYFRLHESFVCAGGEVGKDTCKGDGGSPLICPIPGETDRYQQVGIVAWGIGCGGAGIPGVYVNVALFRNWIDNELSKYSFDTSRYEY